MLWEFMNRVFSEVVSILGSLLCSLWAVGEQVYPGTILHGKKVLQER